MIHVFFVVMVMRTRGWAALGFFPGQCLYNLNSFSPQRRHAARDSNALSAENRRQGSGAVIEAAVVKFSELQPAQVSVVTKSNTQQRACIIMRWSPY